MTFFDTIKSAGSQIRKNMLRSILTILGIVIGITAIIAVTTIGSSGQDRINQELNNFGINRIYVTPGEHSMGKSVLTLEDVEMLEEEVEGVVAVCPAASRSTTVASDGKKIQADVVGTSEAVAVIQNKEMLYGRYLSENDVTYQRKVAVLPEDLADELFFGEDPCGEEIEIRGTRFTIVGVEKDNMPLYNSFIPSQISIPITTMNRLYNITQLSEISLSVEDAAAVDTAADQCISAMVDRYGRDQVKVMNLSSEIQNAQHILDILQLVIAAIALISLLVGGIGIMNIMLVTVSERTKEIGVRKALGAGEGDILRQFLTEALFYAFIGGAAGVILGIVLSNIAGGIIGIEIIFNKWMILFSFLFAGVVGVAFGMIPAYRAARLDPVEALRKE